MRRSVLAVLVWATVASAQSDAQKKMMVRKKACENTLMPPEKEEDNAMKILKCIKETGADKTIMGLMESGGRRKRQAGEEKMPPAFVFMSLLADEAPQMEREVNKCVFKLESMVVENDDGEEVGNAEAITAFFKAQAAGSSVEKVINFALTKCPPILIRRFMVSKFMGCLFKICMFAPMA